ncbi:hypothetical protein IW262DRAFT_1459336 [Armillaria fumosa]|nr:hypothetical protein IW262DRAFT_1459336 [Armillaria fumosa]
MASMVPTVRTAADMETNASTGALIPHGLSFQGNPMHPAKRQSGINKRAIPVYTLDNETMSWLRRQHYEDVEHMASLRQDVQNKDGELRMVWSALNQQTNTLEDITKEKEWVEKMLVELKENDETTRQHLLQLEGTMKQKDNELITLNTRITAAAPLSMSNASMSGVPSASAPGASMSQAPSSFDSGSASGVPSSSTQGASMPRAPSSSTIPGSTSKTSSSSQRPGTGRTPIKVAHNNVTLPISSLRIKRQSETSEQMPEQQEDIDMDGADLPNINDVTLNDASAKELLKMCTLFLKAAVTGKAQLRKDNPVRYSPSKKTAARMEQREQMSKNEINALQRFIRKQFLTLTGIGMLEEFISYEPVEESLVITFREGMGNGPEDEFYTLDFSPGFRGSRWNRIIINNMVGVIQAELLQEGHLVDVDNAYIKETLRNLLSSAQQKWAAAIPRFKKGKPELETEAEVVERLTETSRRANAKALSHAAKDRKHKTRTTIVKKIIYLKIKQRVNDLPVWKFMQRLVEYLGPGGMSSEETEVRQIGGRVETIYLIKVCLWRHEDITQHMMEIDDYGRSVIKRWDKHLPQERENGPRFDEEVRMPAGLPRSLYDPDWLESLEEDDREEMAVSEEVFELLERMVPEEVTIQEVE